MEFENNRELYDWVLDNLDVPRPQPRQYEMARLNLEYTVLSKRRLLALVKDVHVSVLGRSSNADHRRDATTRSPAQGAPHVLRHDRRGED